MKARAALGCLVAGLAAVQVLPVQAAAPLPARLASHQQSERRLRRSIAAENRRIAAVQGSLAQVDARVARVQARLDAERARLASLQARLRAARAHLVILELRMRRADAALTANLVAQYENNPPDMISVIMNSNGFADLLDRAAFFRRIQQRDDEVVRNDRRARIRVIQLATTLGSLQVRAQAGTKAMLAERNQIDTLRLAVLRRRDRLVTARDRRSAQPGARSRRGDRAAGRPHERPGPSALAGRSGRSGSRAPWGWFRVPAAGRHSVTARDLEPRPGRRHHRSRAHAAARRRLRDGGPARDRGFRRMGTRAAPGRRAVRVLRARRARRRRRRRHARRGGAGDR